MDRLAGAVTQHLGEDDLIQYRAPASGLHELRGVFDERYQAIDPETGREVSMEDPRVFIQASALPMKPARGAFVVARGTRYVVSDVQSDRNPVAVLKLQR